MQFNSPLKGSQSRFSFSVYFELIVVMSLVCIFIFLMMRESPTQITKARITEFFTQVTAYQREVSEHYLEKGIWPEAQTLLDNRSDSYLNNHSYIQTIYFDGLGGLHAKFHNTDYIDGKTLSIMASINPETSPGSILWVCGWAKPFPNYFVESNNRTNVSKRFLTSVCRE